MSALLSAPRVPPAEGMFQLIRADSLLHCVGVCAVRPQGYRRLGAAARQSERAQVLCCKAQCMDLAPLFLGESPDGRTRCLRDDPAFQAQYVSQGIRRDHPEGRRAEEGRFFSPTFRATRGRRWATANAAVGEEPGLVATLNSGRNERCVFVSVARALLSAHPHRSNLRADEKMHLRARLESPNASSQFPLWAAAMSQD
jgi:hypothetical protein